MIILCQSKGCGKHSFFGIVSCIIKYGCVVQKNDNVVQVYPTIGRHPTSEDGYELKIYTHRQIYKCGIFLLPNSVQRHIETVSHRSRLQIEELN